MTDAEITRTVKSLPAVPVVMAKDMLSAQGWKASAEERAAILARADFFEAMGMSREVHVKVIDVYTNARIGSLIYNA